MGKLIGYLQMSGKTVIQLRGKYFIIFSLHFIYQ
jgi:hypothetical protein